MRRLRDEQGQALVEFSLVLPVVLLLLLGILQVGLVLNARQTVDNAARVAADTYARTLDPASASGEATSAAAQLSPRLAAPAGTISYTVIALKQETRCVSAFWSRCGRQVTQTVRSERTATSADPGKSGDLVRASIRYVYPLPVGGFFARILPTNVTLTGEAISLIEAPAPAATRSICYEVIRTFDALGNPIDLSATVNGSPAARIRATPGTDQLVEMLASPGRALRPYDPVPGVQTVKRETVRLTGSAQAVSTDSSVSWSFFGGSSVSSYRFRAAVTLRPTAAASCSGSDQR